MAKMSRKTEAKSILRELPLLGLSHTKRHFLERILNGFINGDIVPVVRCKECKYWDVEVNECGDWCGFHKDDFCSYGERRTE